MLYSPLTKKTRFIGKKEVLISQNMIVHGMSLGYKKNLGEAMGIKNIRNSNTRPHIYQNTHLLSNTNINTHTHIHIHELKHTDARAW